MRTTSTSSEQFTRLLPSRVLADYRAEVKGELFRQIRLRFQELKMRIGLTQDQLAKRLSLDKGLLSRRMRGEHDMRIESLSDLARGLECRIEVKLLPLESVAQDARVESEVIAEMMRKANKANSKTEILGAAGGTHVEHYPALAMKGSGMEWLPATAAEGGRTL